MKYNQIPHIHYPNPYLRVNDFVMLDGAWDFSFSEKEEIPSTYENKIIVPYPYETKLSGINIKEPRSSMWYHRILNTKKHDGRILLHFEGVDYQCILYVNNKEVGSHKGGYISFYFDITDYVKEGSNDIALHVYDSLNKSQLSGKQRRREENYECWYTQYSGIWKDVYLEYVGYGHIKNIQVTPHNDGRICVTLDAEEERERTVELYQANKLIKFFKTDRNSFTFTIDNPLLWSIKEPNLYDLRIISDYEVSTSFGIREYKALEDGVYLNNEKVYLRMVLDQGYWKDSLTTPPDKEALYRDISLTLDLGFNAIRKHQKIEDVHFYYLCDCLGVLCTAEIPSAYVLDKEMQEDFKRTLKGVNEELYNSASLFSWLLFNECWGVYDIYDNVETQKFVKEMVNLTKNNDKTRLIIANDGWHQMEETDIASFHEYQQDGLLFKEKYASKEKVLNDPVLNGFGPLFAKGNKYQNQPIVCSECGGVSMSQDGWGYGQKASKEDYLKRISSVITAIYSLPYISGFCYTQLTDVEQETNGLLDIERNPKADISQLRDIFKGGNN